MMAYPLSGWFKKKSQAIAYMRRLVRGGYSKSSVYIKSAMFKFGGNKPMRKKEYRVMKRR